MESASNEAYHKGKTELSACPYCDCGEQCGREPVSMPEHDRVLEVFSSVLDLYSKHRWAIDLDPLYLAQELVFFGYFHNYDPPSIVDVGAAVDVVRELEARGQQ